MSLSKKELGLEEGNFIINGKELVANVIYEAITCKSYPTLPRNIETITNKVTELYKKEFKKFTLYSEDYYTKTFKDYTELLDWLKDYILPIKEIQDLNLTENEIENGITDIEDRTRDKFVFSSRYSKAIPIKEDFVDLDAYIRNLCHDLIREKIEINFSTFN